MAIEKIPIEKFLELAAETPVIDVRSPSEFSHAHIPGAFNIPLFTDEERKIVGTTYKQESREKAIKKGIDFFAPKMNQVIEDCRLQIAGFSSRNPGFESNTLLLYCWRGGMRSAAIAWLLDLFGYKVYTLIGGYKRFRNLVLDVFKQPFSLTLLGGYTGSGKTEILAALSGKGELIIDLEEIARHKGSAFGNIGMPGQPGQEMFENILALKLRQAGMRQFSNGQPIWLEDESQRIGHVNIPGELWINMRSSPLYFLDIPFEKRLDHLVMEYGRLDKQKMIDAIIRIREKLGGLNAQTAIRYLEEGNTRDCFSILLKYYDKFYFKALHNRKELETLLHTIPCKSVTTENAQLLVNQSKYQTESL